MSVRARAAACGRAKVLGFICGFLSSACSGSSPWSAQPSGRFDESFLGAFEPPASEVRQVNAPRSRVIGEAQAPESPVDNPSVVEERIALARWQGRVLGAFRNTYYDFPNESEFDGPSVSIFGPSCAAVARVPRPFFETLCVQGSGLLSSGEVVSFSRRNCSCAEVCPRTGQKICFDALDRARFPWGRGAMGQAITPLLTVAVDSDVIALGTAIYIPEFEGLPRDAERSTTHDGCFIAQDRGLRVKGKHVDIFTGEPALTRLYNSLLPSNRGVTVVVDSPRCARAP